jgi:hypothetical protein
MFKEDARRRREVVIFNPRGWISVIDHENGGDTDGIESMICGLGMVFVPLH